MSFDNLKYDVEINNVPYRVRNYQKSEVSTFIPRLSAGEQTDSDFDLLRSKTLKSFEGGMLQRQWIDDTSVFGSENLYPVYDDGVLYPVNSLATTTNIIGKDNVTAICVTGDTLFYAKISYTLTTTIYKVDSAGTRTSLTLPGSLSGKYISSMVMWQGYLMISTHDGAGLWQCNIQSTSTVTEITTGETIKPYLLCTFNDSLYFTNADTDAWNTKLYKYNGTISSKAGLLVGTVPSYITSLAQGGTMSASAKLFVYNNRLMLTRTDGLWAYDGVRFLAVENLTGQENTQNYSYACVLKGYMYYFMPDGMYRFNGSLIEKLYDISEIGVPRDMYAAKGRLWILYSNASTASSRYDKSMGYDNSSNDNLEGRVMVFNGKALYTYARTATFVKNPAIVDLNNQDEVSRIWWFNDTLYVSQYYPKQSNGGFWCTTNEVANTGNKDWRIISSIFDGDFPMIDKDLENLEITLDGNVVSDQTITLEYRIAGYDGSTGWTSLGSILTQTRLKEYTFRNIPTGITFKDIQFRLSGTTDARYGIKKVVVRYLLSPNYKWQWNFTALCYGDDPLAPLMLADGTESSQIVSLLRGNIYSARQSDIPIKFIDIDQLDLNGPINNSVTSVVLNSTNMIKGDDGFIQIDDEIMYWTAKTSTTLTVQRGKLGTSAASHSDNAKVFIVYRVIIRTISNERVVIADPNPDITEDKSRNTEISLVLQEV